MRQRARVIDRLFRKNETVASAGGHGSDSEPRMNTDEHRYGPTPSVFICIHLWFVVFIE
jgi:hypothetical protein